MPLPDQEAIERREHEAAVHRSEAFRRQASKVNEEVEKLWDMRKYVAHPEDNLEVRFARNTLAVLIGEPTMREREKAA